MATSKPSYDFTLVLDGVSDLTDEVTDALYGGQCDDALVLMRDGVVYVDFTREADSFAEAVLSAINDVESSEIGARVVRVEPDDLVDMAEIARRTGRSRESVRQLVHGERGPGTFPPPVANLRRRSPIWRWTDVMRWFAERQVPSAPSAVPATGSPSVYLDASVLTAALNASLELRRQLVAMSEAQKKIVVCVVNALVPKRLFRGKPKAGGSNSRVAGRREREGRPLVPADD
jgi:predicted DNA-binding transcriptional regulator AlpA